TQCFAFLKEIIHHPLLDEEEKYLWIWLATQSANNTSFSCSYTYEHISQAVNKPLRKVHRILTRLRIMGFLIADLPIYYGEPTPQMAKKTYLLELTSPPKPIFQAEEMDGLVLPPRQHHIQRRNLKLNNKEGNKGAEELPLKCIIAAKQF